MSSHVYADYKDSGIPWVGKIPDHWKIVPLLGVATERDESNAGMRERNLLSLSYGRIIRKDIESNDGLLPESFETYQIVRPGDIVLRLTDLQNDKRSLRSALVDEEGIITSAYLAIQPIGVRPTFLGHLLRAYDLTKVFYSMGGGLRQSMKFADLKRMPLVLPPESEQIAISHFLEKETVQIDKLVREQKRLIELLIEKRQSTISLLVSRGENLSVQICPSNVEVIGDMPIHWKVGGLTKFIGPIVDYRGRTPVKGEAGMFLVTARNIKAGKIDYDASEEYVDPAEAAQLLARGMPEIGDVLFTTEAPLGQVAQIDRLGIALAQRIVKFRGVPNVLHNKFLKYWIMSSQCQAQLDMLATGSTASGIKSSKIGMVQILIPPIDEQISICDAIDSELAKIDVLASEAARGIDLLVERRAALITAAVTGKIDVRGLVAKQSEETEEAVHG